MRGSDQLDMGSPTTGPRSSVQRSILLSALERYGNLVLFLVTTAVLARLLTPVEFGISAVVSAITGVIAASFQEFGGANYLIQKRELTRDSVRTAFTVMLTFSVLIAVGLLAVSGPVSRLFEQQGLRSGLAVSALNFLIVPVYGIVGALFRRDMDFGKLAICNFAAGVATAVVSIALAIWGLSYMAPIWGTFVGNLVLMLVMLGMRPDLGAFRPSFAELRDVLSFGLYSSGVSVINVLYNLSPQLFLAKILDFASVGLYSRATNITQVFDRLIGQVLAPVIMPAIVSKGKDVASLRGVYLEAIELLSAVQWPFLIFTAVMAGSIVQIWLGPTWLEIVPLVRILCIANLALFAASLSYPVLVAAGSVRDALVSSFISLPPSLLIIFCAAFFGVQAVAASALLTLPFQAAVSIYIISRRLRVKPEQLSCALLKSSVVTVITATGMLACLVLIQASIVPAFVGLVLSGGVAGLLWWLGLTLTGHPLLNHIKRSAKFAPWLRPRQL